MNKLNKQDNKELKLKICYELVKNPKIRPTNLHLTSFFFYCVKEISQLLNSTWLYLQSY